MRQEAVLGAAGAPSALEWQGLQAKTVCGGPVPAAAAGRRWGLGAGDLVPEFWRRWVVWGQVFPPLHPQDKRGKGR